MCRAYWVADELGKMERHCTSQAVARRLLHGGLMQVFRLCSILAATLAASAALAADPDNGRRVAEMRCVTCHIVSPTPRRDVSDAPPFEVIARKFAPSPETLAFSLLDPHPRMNVMLTRREAQDIAAYINTLAM
jgi:mono/diheme cytochrome c family protein